MSALDVQVGGDHYKKLKIQPVEYMHANGIPFIEGCIIKYASRWRDKGGIADLEKIKHFAQLLIDLEEAEAASEQCKPVEEVRKTGGKIPDGVNYIVGECASEQCVPNNSIPSWARWIATDQDGEKYCYENMPEIDEEHLHSLYWFCKSGKEQFLDTVESPINARTTLLSLDQQ